MQKQIPCIFIVSLLFWYTHATAQQCTNRYRSVVYKSSSWDSFTKAIATPAGEWLAVGNIIDDHAMIAKFSSKGTPLFSYQYNPVYQFNTTYFAKLRFTDVIRAKDGTFIAVGNVFVDKWIGQSQYLNWGGVILKIDPYGNGLWCKRLMTRLSFNNNNFSVASTNVTETASGDLLVYVAADYGNNYAAYGRVVCYSSQGLQKWSIKLATGDYTCGPPGLQTKRAIRQLRDGSVVFADPIYKTGSDGRSDESMLHFFNLDPLTGKIRWETFYHYPLNYTAPYSDFTSATELANGNLVFTLSSYPLSGSKKGIRIESDNKGRVKAAMLFTTPDNLENQLVHGVTDHNTGNESYLLKTPLYSMIVNVSNTGSIVWQKGYNHANGTFPGSCFAANEKGYGIFMSSFRSRDMRILYTDPNGGIDCVTVPSQVTTQPVSLTQETQMKTETDVSDPPGFTEFDFPVQPTPNPLPSRIECEEISFCCQDVIDSTSQVPVRICEGSTYVLPDGQKVVQSGTYFVTYKTAGGCDSIRYYQVKVDKHPNALSLGPDLCLDKKDTVQLMATPGYDGYQWMNQATTPLPVFKTLSSGTYWVNVTNSCGSKTDSLTIYDVCDFPVLMPSAFSPNGDGKNDYFRVPPQNKNKFVSMQIFNRWGNLVFLTKDGTKGWDGTQNRFLQPTGIYIYFLEMMGLSGKKISKSGTVLLTR